MNPFSIIMPKLLNNQDLTINESEQVFEYIISGSATEIEMAAFLAIFAITMLIQFISYYFKSIADYRNEPMIFDKNENT